MVHFNKTTIAYKNLKTGVYFVQPYTIGPVASTEFGEATIIAPHEFASKIADSVLTNLEKFGKEKYDKSRAILRNDKQQAQFLENHVGVSVSEQDCGDLKIYALHRERGGMVGSHEDTFVLSKDEILEKLTAIMAEAFKRAS